MIAHVRSEEAEAACRLINSTIGAYLMAEKVDDPEAEGDRRLRLGGNTRLVEQRDAALIRIMSITESFCGELLIEEYESDDNPVTPKPPADRWEAATISATASWDSQIKHYKKWLNIDDLDWGYVQGVAIARNAVAHGMGRLTRSQVKKLETTMERLAYAEISLIDDRVHIDTSRLRSIAAGCIAHVLAVDHAVRNRPR